MTKCGAQEELDSSSGKVMLDSRSIIYLGFYLFHNHFSLLSAFPGFLSKIRYCCDQPVIAIIDPLAGFESVFDTREEKQLFFIYLFLKLRDDISYTASGLNSCHSLSTLNGVVDMALIGNKIPRLPEEFNLTDAAIEAFLELIPLLNRAMFIKLLIESDKIVELLKLIFSLSVSGINVCTTRILEVIKK
jgi:hypothetical protein